ncbi:ATP-binding protein [Lignipirellula cremea]|uniref:ATP-dependent zinc metalloprotease FtsH n=1 Tax=Lignipirellula cremea TaxID=2528010 RepID=A0A518DZV8_9BACT|nr:ATP-binding protein [Lignipirellula cremea]QDU97374.1 ATP-dependent zinc metalloprotease FtsH [Lignipirellula cremea]
MTDDPIQGLRDALQVSPDNVPLRVHLAKTLAGLGRLEEAEQEYRDALSREPQDTAIKLALAGVYRLQQKSSQAMVIVENICRVDNAPPAALVLYARLLLNEGDVRGAVAQYKLALEVDPAAADETLGQELGVSPHAGGDNEENEVFEGRVRQSWQAPSSGFEAELERPKISFADVGGMEALKEEIRLKILYPLQHPEMYAAYGKTIGGGILMYGPPGCGKTWLARATAGEIGAGFISVGISDVLDMWTGQSERNLRDLFQQARANQPCVLFFDEADALGARRSDMNSGSARQLINQFLSEMDGVDHSNEGVLVLAATNAPWHIDPAFRRPGRFDRVLFVPPPDLPGRAEILQLQLRNKPQAAIDYVSLAKRMEGYSGADLKAVVDQAIEGKLREAMKTGQPQPLTNKDLITAAKALRPSTTEWFSTARNYAVYSNQGGLYDDVLKYLKL